MSVVANSGTQEAQAVFGAPTRNPGGRGDESRSFNNSPIDSFEHNYRRITAVLPQIAVLLPVRLTIAARITLGAAGCSLTLFRPQGPISIGASDDLAAACERQELRARHGPADAAHRSGIAMDVGRAELRRQWPALADYVGRNARYVRRISVPVARPEVAFTVDLWFTDRQRTWIALPEATAAVADRIGTIVTQDPFHWPGRRSAWSGLHTVNTQRAASNRTSLTTLLVALGMIGNACNRSLPSALGALRDHALRVGRPLQQVADDIAHQRRPVPAFSPTGLM